MVMKFFLLKFCNREILNLLYVCDILIVLRNNFFISPFLVCVLVEELLYQ